MQTAAILQHGQRALDVLELWQARRIETAEAENVWASAVARSLWTRDFKPTQAKLGTGRGIFAGHWTHLTHALAYGNTPDASVVRTTTEFFRSRSERPVIRLASLWPDTIRMFEQAGYRAVSDSLVVARELSANSVSACDTAAVTVTQGAADPNLAWIRASSQGFCDRDAVNDGELQIGAALALNPDATLLSVGSAAGEICSTAALTVQSGMGMFFGDSTRLAWRGMGLQRGLITARLSFAASLGCDLAVAEVQERSGSARNYERAGFRSLYRRTTYVLDC